MSIVKDFENLLDGRLLEVFPAESQGCGELDGRILHALVRFRGTANEKEMLASGEPLMSVLIVQPHAEETHDTTLFPILVVRHGARSRNKERLAPAHRIYVSGAEPVKRNLTFALSGGSRNRVTSCAEG
jgi:hypothetical protein